MLSPLTLVILEAIPFIDRNHQSPTTFKDIGRYVRILLGDAFLRIHHQYRHVGLLNCLYGLDHREFFNRFKHLAALADACARAAAVTGDTSWLTGVEMSVTWLLGDNDARIPMLDERTGGCSDALSRTSRSRNQGAESTLAMISVLQQGRRLNTAAAH